MRLLNNNNNISFSLLKFMGSGAQGSTVTPADIQSSIPASTLPSGMESSLGGRTSEYAKAKGRTMAQKLRTMFKNSKAEKLPPSIPLNPAVGLREGLISSHKRFQGTHSDINNAMKKWKDGDETLHFLLRPFVQAAKKQPGVPQTYGLRSGVTGLQGMATMECGASKELRDAAINLSTTPIFIMKSPDGTEKKYTLLDFGTPGEHGIGKIDDLNLPKEQRAQVAQRLGLALTELSNLGNAYIKNGAVPAPLMDRANCVVLTPPSSDPAPRNSLRRPDARPKGPRPMPMPRQAAQETRRPPGTSPTEAQASVPRANTPSLEFLSTLAGSYLSVEELQPILDDPSKLTDMAAVLIERHNQHTQGR